MKDISIYIPCYNARETIGMAIEGILAQSVKPHEVIIVDDCSEDDSISIISKYPVTVIKNKKNLGLAKTRNIALNAINTPFVASIDSDCVPSSIWLENLYNIFNEPSLYGIIGAGGKLTEWYRDTDADSWRGFAMKQHWGEKKISPLYLFGSNTLFKTEALKEVGGYNEKYKTNYEDVDISSRLKQKGYSFLYEPDASIAHYKRDTVSSVLKSYWRWQSLSKIDSGRYNSLDGLKTQIYLNLSYAYSLINRAVIEGCDRGILYLSSLVFISHSFLDIIKFIEISLEKNGNQPPCLSFSYKALLDRVLNCVYDLIYRDITGRERFTHDLSHLTAVYEDLDTNVSNDETTFINFFDDMMVRYVTEIKGIFYDKGKRSHSCI